MAEGGEEPSEKGVRARVCALVRFGIQKVVPSSWSVGDVGLSLGCISVKSIESADGSCRCRDLELRWRVSALLTPRVPFLEIYAEEVVACRGEALTAFREHYATKTGDENGIIWCMIMMLLEWCIMLIVTDLRVRVMHSTLENLIDTEMSSFDISYSAMHRLSISGRAAVSKSNQEEARDIAFTYNKYFGLKQSSTFSLVIGSTYFGHRDCPGIRLRCREADNESARLYAEIIDASSGAPACTINGQTRPGDIYDFRVKLLEAIDFTINDTDIKLYHQVKQYLENECFSSLSDDSSEKHLQSVIEFAFILKAPLSLSFKGSAVTVDKSARLAAKRQDGTWALRADIPTSYAVSSQFSADLRDLDIAWTSEKHKKIRASRLALRLADLSTDFSKGDTGPAQWSTSIIDQWSAKLDELELSYRGQDCVSGRGLSLTEGNFLFSEVRFTDAAATLMGVRYSASIVSVDNAHIEDLTRLRARILSIVAKNDTEDQAVIQEADKEQKYTLPELRVASALVGLTPKLRLAASDFVFRLNGHELEAGRLDLVFEERLPICVARGLRLREARIHCTELEIIYLAQAWSELLAADDLWASDNSNSSAVAVRELHAEHLEATLPTTSLSRRGIRIKGNEATLIPVLDAYRFGLRNPCINEAQSGRPLADLGHIDISILRHQDTGALRSIEVKTNRFSTSSNAMDIDDYQLLRHALWRNLGNADCIGELKQIEKELTIPTQISVDNVGEEAREQEEIRFVRVEFHIGTLNAKLKDREVIFGIDANDATLCFDRADNEFFVIATNRLAIDGLALPKKGQEKSAFRLCVAPEYLSIAVAHSALVWPCDGRAADWWRFKNFFAFDFKPDVRDGPVPGSLLASVEEEESAFTDWAFMLALQESSLDLAEASQCPLTIVTTGSLRYALSSGEWGYDINLKQAQAQGAISYSASKLRYNGHLLAISDLDFQASDWMALTSDMDTIRRLAAKLFPGAASATAEKRELKLSACRSTIAELKCKLVQLHMSTTGEASIESLDLESNVKLAHVRTVTLAKSGQVTLGTLEIMNLAALLAAGRTARESAIFSSGSNAQTSLISNVKMEQATINIGSDLDMLLERPNFSITGNFKLDKAVIRYRDLRVMTLAEGASLSNDRIDVGRLDAALSPSLLSSATSAWLQLSAMASIPRESASKSSLVVVLRQGRIEWCSEVMAELTCQLELGDNSLNLRINSVTIAGKPALSKPVEARGGWSTGIEISSLDLILSDDALARCSRLLLSSTPASTTSSKSSPSLPPIQLRGCSIMATSSKTKVSVSEVTYGDDIWCLASPEIVCDGIVFAELESLAERDNQRQHAEECVIAIRAGSELLLASRPLWSTSKDIFGAQKRPARLVLRAHATSLEVLMSYVHTTLGNSSKTIQKNQASSPFVVQVAVRVLAAKERAATPRIVLASTREELVMDIDIEALLCDNVIELQVRSATMAVRAQEQKASPSKTRLLFELGPRFQISLDQNRRRAAFVIAGDATISASQTQCTAALAAIVACFQLGTPASAELLASACRRAAKAASRIAPLNSEYAACVDIFASLAERFISTPMTVLAENLPPEPTVPRLYRVVFKTATLGMVLGVRNENGGAVVVESVSGPAKQLGVRSGDLLLAVAGASVKRGDKCLDVGRAISEAPRPLHVDFLRPQSLQIIPPIDIADEKDTTNHWTWSVVAAGKFRFTASDSSIGDVRLSVGQIDLSYDPTEAEARLGLRHLRLDSSRPSLPECWEPLLEPCALVATYRDDTLEVSTEGDDDLDPLDGDGDIEAVRMNVSLSLLRTALRLRNLGLRGLAAAADAAAEDSALQLNLVADALMSPLSSRSPMTPGPLPPRRRQRLVLKVVCLRFSLIDGDEMQSEMLVATLRDMVAEYAHGPIRHASISIQDAQLDSHDSRRPTAPPLFPVVLRVRPRRRKLADFIGTPQAEARRVFGLASATWTPLEDGGLELHDLTASFGKLDMYVDETAARHVRELLARLAREWNNNYNDTSKQDHPSSGGIVVERLDVAKIDARLSVRWSASEEEANVFVDEISASDNASIASTEVTAQTSKVVGSLYAESVVAQQQQQQPRQQRTGRPPLQAPRSGGQNQQNRRSGGPSSRSEKTPVRAFLDVFAAVERSKITLPALRVSDEQRFTDGSALWKFVIAHYTKGTARNALEIAGSLRALGNPLGLARGVLRGLEDAVREPVEGLVDGIYEDRPEAFALGLQRGATSLVHHTVGGTAESLACITGGLSRAASHLALDQEYARRRDQQLRDREYVDSHADSHTKATASSRKKATTPQTALIDGLANGFDSAVGGVVDGVTGLVQAPIRGLEEGGAAGALQGVGRGVLGLVVKPVVGVADAATDVLRGIRRTTAAGRAYEDADTISSTTDATIHSSQLPVSQSEDDLALLARRQEVNTTRIGTNNTTATARMPTSLSDASLATLNAVDTRRATEELEHQLDDETPAHRRPRRALHGRGRQIHVYSRRDASAVLDLQRACRDLGLKPTHTDAFRARVDLDEHGALAVVTDGAVAVLRPELPPILIAPVALLMGCTLNHEDLTAELLIARDRASFSTQPPERRIVNYRNRATGQSFRDVLADAIARARQTAVAAAAMPAILQDQLATTPTPHRDRTYRPQHNTSSNVMMTPPHATGSRKSTSF